MDAIDVLHQITEDSIRAYGTADLAVGTVTGTDPLKVKIREEMTDLPEEVLWLTEPVMEKKIPVLQHLHTTDGFRHSHALPDLSHGHDLPGELKILGNLLDDLPRRAADEAVAGAGLQVAELVVADDVNDGMTVPALGEHPAQEDELAVHGEPDRVPLHKGDAPGGVDGELQCPGRAGAVGGVGDLLNLGRRVPGLAGTLFQNNQFANHRQSPSVDVVPRCRAAVLVHYRGKERMGRPPRTPVSVRP